MKRGRRQVRRRRADPALRAPVRRGDEARRRPAREVPRQDRGLHQGHRRGGDRIRRRARHRKSLVNTILTNNGYTVVDLGKQVPDRDDHRRGVEHQATAIGLSALLVSTSTADAAVRRRAARAQARVPRAGRRRGDQPRLRPPDPLPHGQGVRRDLRARRLLLQGRLPGLSVMDQLVDAETRDGLVEKMRVEAKTLREKGRGGRRRPPTTDASVRSGARTDVAIPTPPWLGAREVPIDLDDVFPHLDLHVLFKLHWGGRGVKAPTGTSCCARTSSRAWSACGASRTTAPARAAGLLALQRRRQRADVSTTPRIPSASSSAWSSRASRATTASA